MQVARRVISLLGFVNSMHAVPIRDAYNHGLGVDGVGPVILHM